MPRLLFISNESAVAVAMAAALATARGGLKVEVAATESGPADPEVLDFFSSHALSWPPRILAPNAVSTLDYDLLINLSSNDALVFPALPGTPPQVHWKLASEGHDLTTLHQALRARIANLFDQGYLTALIQARKNAELLLDNLHDGVLAHDLERRIFFFNRAAEQITGYDRQEVLGKDCHTVFAGGLCGKACSFCDAESKANLLPVNSYPLTITNRQGEKRYLEMSVVAMANFFGNRLGVVASFRDITREAELAARLGEENGFAGIIGRDPRMQELFQAIRDLAPSNASVLIQGESGTGKELVAAAIHNEGPRYEKLFVPVNCGALPENLLESELFGHVRGAFTGAIRDKKGRFELADGGTLFLDEIGDITTAMQVKLLRVLQDGTFQRLGDEKTIQSNVRVISATHKDLRAEIAAGRFREDLYYRLSVVPLILPPLRERRNDIPQLARFFLKRFEQEEGRAKIGISPEVMDQLIAYDWPGNVRELQNVIRYLLVHCREGAARLAHLPPSFLSQKSRDMSRVVLRRKRPSKLDARTVNQALHECDNNRVRAAKLLKVSRATLYRFLARQNPAG